MAPVASIHEKLAVARSKAVSGKYTGALTSFDGVIDEIQRQADTHRGHRLALIVHLEPITDGLVLFNLLLSEG